MVDYWGRSVGANVSRSDFKYYINKFGVKVYGRIDMQGQQFVNLPNPNNDFDAATKSYVDTTSYLYLPLIGGTVNGDLIVSADTSTVRKLGCDNLGVNTGNLQSFMLLLGSNEERIQAVTNQSTAIFNAKGLIVVCNGNNVVKFGTSLTDSRTNFYQDVILNSYGITNVKDTANAQDAATKNYVDTNDNLRIFKAGDTMSGTLNMNNNSITNVKDPQNNGYAVNKSYVDARLNNSGLLVNLTGATGNKNGAIVTASSNYSTSYSAWKIWNFTIAAIQPNNEWGTAAQVTNYWVMIQNVNAMLVWKCHLAGRWFEGNQPYVWRIEGSNNGTTFTTLYSSNVALTTTVQEFVFNPIPTAAYKYFRFYAVSSVTALGNPGLSHFMLF